MKAHPVQPACPRLFEVEALRDGRLNGAEVARFESHVRTCAVCAQEMQAMAELGEALRSTTTAHEADQLQVRRERTRLLAAFDASLVPVTPKSSRPKLWLGGAAAVAVLLLVAFALRSAHPDAPIATSAESVKVQAATTTKWSRHAESQRETITLETGTLSIRVAHQLPRRRLLVLLPDGELEDIGTTFTVSAAAGHTTQVTVQEGSVILRLREAPALTLRAGDSWIPAPSPVAIAEAPSQTSALPLPRPHHPKPPLSAAVTPSVSAPEAHAVPEATSAPSVADSAALPDPAADFRAAMSAFTDGDNSRASRLFATFLSQHPRDSRAEDAAYLRVLALQRAGHASAMSQAAAEYLKRYPHGFRRAEVEPLSR